VNDAQTIVKTLANKKRIALDSVFRRISPFVCGRGQVQTDTLQSTEHAIKFTPDGGMVAVSAILARLAKAFEFLGGYRHRNQTGRPSRVFSIRAGDSSYGRQQQGTTGLALTAIVESTADNQVETTNRRSRQHFHFCHSHL